ncbi:serine/threonine-protein kinase [Granulicella sp. L46]|uniref:serine/threonine-protein kinase n=1 Tax=Granulicella sp. L46 TaxID=1641865 RepID=UPI00131CC04F|nr:serine/threonine-protein kinase [Granulicella sp. L46]
MDKQDEAAERLFEEAVGLQRDRRSAFLDGACAGKPDLRRTVEGLLHSSDRLSGFLSEAAYVPAGARGATASESAVLNNGMRLLGRYVISGRLGAGGMGVVYQAHDQKLDREIAIKMLQRGLLTSDEARARFRREAQALAKLNHAHIAAVYDVIEEDDADCIVMELVEGESLAAKLRRGPLPVKEATTIALEVAEALVEAHEHGVIHRDLKPANVMITSKGRAKVLDFGLARLLLGPADLTQATAETIGVMGTPLYMSPEQANGEAADARSDLWSLGVTYYESLTGTSPFRRPTTLGILRAITDEAVRPLREVRSETPVLAEQIVMRALEKGPELRYQRASDLATDLQRVLRDLEPSRRIGLEAQTEGGSSGIVRGSARRRRRLVVALAVLVVLAIAASLGWRFWPRARPFAAVSVDQITQIGSIERIALSADARFLAEVKNDKGQHTVWIRNMATNTETQVLHAYAKDYLGLTFSPDGNHLYFTRLSKEHEAASELYVMPVFGGAPRQLIFNVDSPVSFEPKGNRMTFLRWSPERKDRFSEIHIADNDGSNDQVLYSTAEEALAPVWSPDGKRIAWLETEAGTTTMGLKVIEISSRKAATVKLPAGISWASPGVASTTLAWMPDNLHLLVFYNKHSERAQIGVIDVRSGQFHTVTNDVNSYSELALSGNGRTLATVLTNVETSIAFYGADGGEPISTLPLRITPDTITWATEDKLLYIVGASSIGTIDRATGSLQSFDTGKIMPGNFIASCPDGHILFTGFTNGGGDGDQRLFRMNADGGEIAQLSSSGYARSPSCSVDSQKAYFNIGSDASVALWSIPISGGTPKELVSPVNYSEIMVSPDGTEAALFALREQKICVLITDLRSKQVKAPFFLDQSVEGGTRFSPDGRSIVSDVHRDGGNTLLDQPLDGSSPRALFNLTAETIGGFDWAPSAKQLAVTRLKTSSDVVLIIDQSGKEPL